MELFEALRARESCRAYSTKPLEKEKIEKLLEVACMAPSAGNGQPWRFVAVTDKATLASLSGMTRTSTINQWVEQAPCIIAVWEEISEKMIARYGEQYLQKHWPAVDSGLCALQLCLAATGMGIGSCILGYFPEDEAKKLLNIPEKGSLRLLITLGYPKEETAPREKRRLTLDKVARFIE